MGSQDDIKQVEEVIRRMVVRALQFGPVSPAAIEAEFVKRNPALWERVREPLARAQLETLARAAASKLRRQPVDQERQMPLPGFEHLPLIVRVGKTVVSTVNVRLPGVQKIVERYARMTSKMAIERREFSDWKKLLTMMRFFAAKDHNPEITAEEAILRQSEYDAIRERRSKIAKKAADARWREDS